MLIVLFSGSYQALIQYPDTISAQTAKSVSIVGFITYNTKEYVQYENSIWKPTSILKI